MKRILITLAALSLIASPLAVQAQTPNPEITTTVSPTAKNNKDKVSEQKIEKLQEKAIKAIDRRLTELKKLTVKLGKAKRLAQATKDGLTAEVKKEIDALEKLKISVAAETDIAKLQGQVKDLKTSYKIYALYTPKIHLLMAIDTLTEATARSRNLTNAFTTLIEKAEAAGQDTGTAKTALVHMQSMVTEAQTELVKAQEALKPLTPSDYPANKTTMKDVKKALDAIHKVLQSARQDAQAIRQELAKPS